MKTEQQKEIAEIRKQMKRLDEAGEAQSGLLLLDMQEQYPALRAFLLGTLPDCAVWPNGSLGVRRDVATVRVTIALREWGYESHYAGQNLFELLEIVNTDLEEGTVPWTTDWRSRSEQQRRRQRALDESS